MSTNHQLSQFLLDLRPGGRVLWTDPDRGLASGVFTVSAITTEAGRIDDHDDIVVLRNDLGGVAEVLAHELSDPCARNQARADAIRAELKRLQDIFDLQLADCAAALHDPATAPFVDAARRLYADDDIEVDDLPVVSLGDDGGAFVSAWVHVSADEAAHSPAPPKTKRSQRGPRVRDRVRKGQPGRMVSLAGIAIRGTLDTIQGLAYASTATRNADGSLDPDYEGETKVYWDGQETMRTRSGERIFLDEDANEIPESEIRLLPTK